MMGYSHFQLPKIKVEMPNPYPYPGMDADKARAADELRPGERRITPTEAERMAHPPTEVVIDGKVVFRGDADEAVATMQKLAETARESCEIRMAQA